MAGILDLIQQNVAATMAERRKRALLEQAAQQKAQAEAERLEGLRGQLLAYQQPGLLQQGPLALQEYAQQSQIAPAAGTSLDALAEQYRAAYGTQLEQAPEAVKSVLDLVGQEQQTSKRRATQAAPIAATYAQIERSPSALAGYLEGLLGQEQAAAKARLEKKPGDEKAQLAEEYKIARNISQDALKFADLLGPAEAAAQIRALLYDDKGRLRQEIPGPAVQAIITRFVKSLDPTSVARESEVQGAQESVGWWNSLIQRAQQMARGAVRPDELIPFLDTADKLADVSRRVWERRVSPLRQASEQLLSEQARPFVFGLDPGTAAAQLRQMRPTARPKSADDYLKEVTGAR